MLKYFRLSQSIVALSALATCVVERPGEGEKKKKEALTLTHELLTDLKDPALSNSQWLLRLLTGERILGLVVDALVRAANEAGDFEHKTEG
jgi:hypothetical protein